MSDIAYATWKVQNENKFHLLDIDLYKENTKINFDFIKKNLKLKLSTNNFFIKYLPSIYHFLDNTDLSNNRTQKFINNTKNFDSLFIYRKEISQFKKDKFIFDLKQDIYIESNIYKYIQEKLNRWKEFITNETINFKVSDVNDIYNFLCNIIIPYKIENVNDITYHNISLLKLFICTDFPKYFFKANPKFLVKI